MNLRLTKRSRKVLAGAAMVLLCADAIILWQWYGRRDQLRLVVAPLLPESGSPFGSIYKDAFFLTKPAQLTATGNGWIVEGRHVDDLTSYLAARVRQSPARAGFIENTSIDLGADATFGRAIEALSRLAREGTCLGGIILPDREPPFTMYEIVQYRLEDGKLTACKERAFPPAG